MLFSINYRTRPATDLGYLLHKHPDRVQGVSLAFGMAQVFFPVATPDSCTAALLLDVDPVGIVRGRGATLDQYVNDRPYVSSSMLSVALGRAFNTAMSGRSKDRQSLADATHRFECTITALPCRGHADLLAELFEPLGYRVEATRHPLDPTQPDWGDSGYVTVTLDGTCRLRDLLAHIYVLVPVLDNDKHYWVGPDEVEKLLRRGAGWLDEHPARDLIVRRYLKHQRDLAARAFGQLSDDVTEDDALRVRQDAAEAGIERPLNLNEQRIGSVVAALRACGAESVVDLGCGEGRLLQHLVHDTQVTRVVGVDVSVRALARASERLHLDRLAPRQRERVALLHGSLVYRDRRLAGFDAATLVEVIEHLDAPQLEMCSRLIFEHMRPRTLIVTTPNHEYNLHFAGLASGGLRHSDHRFEWTRAEFAAWVESLCARYGAQAQLLPVGSEHPATGAPTQMAIFTLGHGATA